VSGSPRAFDDGRFPDADGRAECFLCGRKIDPLDPRRGGYTPNHLAFDGLPAHLDCLEREVHDPMRLQAIALAALVQMTETEAKRQLTAANVSVVAPAA
jgi:hypothetical protein